MAAGIERLGVHPWGGTRQISVGAEGSGVWGGDMPLPSEGSVWGRACPCPEKKCTFDSEMTTFWCILTQFLKLGA